jgi:hypothetical protein
MRLLLCRRDLGAPYLSVSHRQSDARSMLYVDFQVGSLCPIPKAILPQNSEKVNSPPGLWTSMTGF